MSERAIKLDRVLSGGTVAKLVAACEVVKKKNSTTQKVHNREALISFSFLGP